jgi:DNA repair exonuclease SbcCD ATPase subunit
MTINPKGKSMLIYGDNGSGKSSIADALEWYYQDRVDRLSCQEIGTKGIEALRNIHIDKSQKAFLSIDFSENILNAEERADLQKR